ncbi:hypothetical protein BCR34DRAFT_638677 [Clohesyomyces aquaticus]|uniref:Secreted LysM effector LysM C-terminal domain-containing protein n=1 Tax=Clohesyomyces aquaticus TaxID=1231657 RepID=A0A1Y2A1A6_9PLEO|nr:hypothetical protein BCR34DRAFT_638677 [Clohesyomyces aquaticus]
MGCLMLHILAFLCASSLAFEVAIYNNVDGCDANGETTYRIIDGISDATCYTFDQPMPNTDCTQFVRGGAEKGPCSNASLLPKSIFTHNQDRFCALYTDPDCKSGIPTLDRCSTASDQGWDHFGSFKCFWDGTVDILGNVGCGNGQSMGVCVNDCGCLCDGIKLACPSDENVPATCTEWGLKACRAQCICVAP